MTHCYFKLGTFINANAKSNKLFFFENQDPFMRRMEGSMIVRHNPCEPNPDMPPSQDELEIMVHNTNKWYFVTKMVLTYYEKKLF